MGMQFVRLPGKKRGLFSHHTLWLGADYLLAVESTGFREQYKRFYFRDIQAIIMRQTARRIVWSVVLAVLVVVAALPLLTLAGSSRPLLTLSWCIVPTLFLIAFLGHLALGPTCNCYVQMPLALHELPSLRRSRHAKKVLAELHPRVRRVQGALSMDKIRQSMSQQKVAGSPTMAWPGLRAETGSQQATRKCGNTVHLLLFGLMMGDTAFTMVQFYCAHPGHPRD
jgi:hypothetical protein